MSYLNLRQPECFSFSISRLENISIDLLPTDDDSLKAQRYVKKYIDYDLKLLLEEVQLPYNEALRIPAVFKNITYL